MKAGPALGWALAGAALAVAATRIVPAIWPSQKEAADEEARPAAAGPDAPIKLDKTAMDHAGIQLETLKPAVQAHVRTGFARALDLSGLAGINSDIVAARAALSASEAEARRQQALAAEDQSASLRAVEAARAQAAADRARLALANRRIGLEYGAGLAGRSGGLDAFLSAAAAGEAALVRLDFQDGPVPPGASVTISDGQRQFVVHPIGPAAAADPSLQSAGVLAIVRGPVARMVSVGRVMSASLPGAGTARAGVLVPREAIVRTDGALWVFRADAEGAFHRIALRNPVAQAEGWFVAEGLRPGDKVAVGGATVLLGIQSGPPAEDE